MKSKALFLVVLLTGLVCTMGVSAPNIVATYNTPGFAKGVAVWGDYAFVADGNRGLQIINISNPRGPLKVAHIETLHARDVAISSDGNYAYVAAAKRLVIINISNKAKPKIIKKISGIGTTNSVVVDAKYAYVAGSAGLNIINISTPASAFCIPKVSTLSSGSSLYALVKSGTYLYVAAGGDGLRIVDISPFLVDNKKRPKVIGTCNTPGCARDVVVSGNFAYIADGNNGLCIINILNKKEPKIYSQLNFNTNRKRVNRGYSYGVALLGTNVYVTEKRKLSGANLAFHGLRVVSVTSMQNPKEVGSCPTPKKARGIVLVRRKNAQGKMINYAFVTDGTSGLRIIDISAPTGQGK